MPSAMETSPARAPTIKTRIEISIDGIPFHLVPHPEYFLSTASIDETPWPAASDQDFHPVTVICCSPATTLDVNFFHGCDKWLRKDDVWQPGFWRNLQLLCPRDGTGSPTLSRDAHAALRSFGVESVAIRSCLSQDQPPAGPYVLGMGRLWQPWRVYNDTVSAMMITFRPSSTHEHGVWEEYDSCYETGGTRVVVPSRAYFTQSETKPLAGVRFASKDMLDVKGFKTSIGSKAYARYHGPATETAALIQRLVDLGAILVGKTKLATFIIREVPTENQDFTPPWNLRGDGYLTPGESSSGSGAAMAAYPWLDMTLASDTCGSSRLPAYLDGVHGIRFSTDLLPKKGMVGFFPYYDAPAMFVRDMHAMVDMVRSILPAPTKPTSSTFDAVLVPTEYLDDLDARGRDQTLAVADGVAETLGLPVTQMSISRLWEETRPDGKSHAPIKEWLREVACLPYFYDACKGHRQFYEQYKQKFGHAPFMNGEMFWRWERVAQYTEADRNASMARLELYRTWFLTTVLKAATTESSGAVLIYPVETGKPQYRDDRPTKNFFAGFDGMNISPITGAAEVTVIPGETPYESRITGRTEYMPFAVSLVGRPGCDVALTDLAAEAVKRAGLPLKLGTGKSIYFEDEVAR